ncbi:hypothetical protein [Nocardia camponoti]|nr:hypothetical protein [Nocardia camponoti]
MTGVAMLVLACGGGTSTESPASAVTSTTRLLEAAATVDTTTPDGVAVAALREIYTWRPVTEQPGDSLARARNLLGPSMIRTLDAPAASEAPKPTLQWAEWAKAKARVDAFAFASGERPPTSTDSAISQYKIGIEQTVVYPNGRTEALPPNTVIATVVRTPQGWRLDAFR